MRTGPHQLGWSSRRSLALAQYQREEALLSPAAGNLLQEACVHAVQFHHRFQETLRDAGAKCLAQSVHLRAQIVAEGGVDPRRGGSGSRTARQVGRHRRTRGERGGRGEARGQGGFGLDHHFGCHRKFEAVRARPLQGKALEFTLSCRLRAWDDH